MNREKPTLESARQFYKSLWTSFEIAFLEVQEYLSKTNKELLLEIFEPKAKLSFEEIHKFYKKKWYNLH